MRDRLELMRWLTRYFARAVIRRLAYAIVALVFAALGIGNARADCFNDVSDDGSVVMCGDQGEAAAGGYSAATKLKAQGIGGVGSNNIRIEGPTEVNMSSRTLVYRVMWASQNQLLARVARGWPEAKSCSDRNATPLADAALSYTEAPSCFGGCAVLGNRFSQANGPVKVYGMTDRMYSGEVCVAAKPSNDIGEVNQEKEDATKPKPPECTALGSNQTACVKSNGDTCATSSTGKTFCWKPSETGKKTDANDAQVKSPKGEPVTPPDIKIPDKDWQRTEGHQQTACVNNTCMTYNVTNFSSVPGGTQKNSTGDNNADGSGNTSGNGKPGSGSGGDGKDDDKDSATESGNCTAPPMCVGDTLKCLQLKFTWKIDCNTQGNEVTKGDGCSEGDIPVCAGKSCKAEAYAGVLQQWKQRCAVEAMGQGMASRAAGISNGDDAGVVEGIWGGEEGGTGLKLRQDLINVGGNGSGGLLPDVEIEGQRWVIPSGFFDAIAAVKMVIIAMCTVIAMFVVGRNI
ncbi:A coat protein [Xanthomonas perforans]|uniref:A coat protein n=1 Tax=Xanthomonas perforans TaxID=442694 RepID=UPI000F8EB942|nr:A coat protein [Xanthomonas perforans]MCC8548755.1 A coat protein [Xanthomonas perforans]